MLFVFLFHVCGSKHCVWVWCYMEQVGLGLWSQKTKWPPQKPSAAMSDLAPMSVMAEASLKVSLVTGCRVGSMVTLWYTREIYTIIRFMYTCTCALLRKRMAVLTWIQQWTYCTHTNAILTHIRSYLYIHIPWAVTNCNTVIIMVRWWEIETSVCMRVYECIMGEAYLMYRSDY